MAGDDDDEPTRFPCLATVRYMVAGVVSLLAVVVVVMVTAAAFRSETIVLSIHPGYLKAAGPLWNDSSDFTVSLPVKAQGEPISDFSWGGDNLYEPVKSLNLIVSLSFHNPSGRADINCGNISFSVLDLPGEPFNNFTEMVLLGTFNLSDPFQVDRETSHTVMKQVPLMDGRALKHIASNYGGRSSFQAMLVANVSASSRTSPGTSWTRPKAVVHYCWPVTVQTYEPIDTPNDVECQLSKEMGYPISPPIIMTMANKLD